MNRSKAAILIGLVGVLPFVGHEGAQSQSGAAPVLTVLIAAHLRTVAFFSLDAAAITDDTGRTVATVEEETKIIGRSLEGKVELHNSMNERIAIGVQLTVACEESFCLDVGTGKFRAYRGALVLRADAGEIAAVHRLTVDEYLLGVLPLEAAPSAPVEYLKAHAVASRSAALARGGRHRAQGYDLCGLEHCERYGGMEVERATTSAAVLETRGKAMIAEGKPIDATYSTNCGGVTAGNDEVWLNTPRSYLRPTFDFAEARTDFVFPFAGEKLSAFVRGAVECNCAPETGSALSNDAAARRAEAFRWKRSLTMADFEKKLNPHNIGVMRDLQIVERGASGRVRELKLVGEQKTISIRGDAAIRSALGLPSSLFDVEAKHSETGSLLEVQFLGAGFGHGVGMCQHGAVTLARRGWTHENILKKYYANVEIKPWYPVS